MPNSYWLTRLWIVRGLGFMYVVAFSIVFLQGRALWGDNGLLPITDFVKQVDLPFWKLPTLFALFPYEAAIPVFGVIGVLGGITLMSGFANVPILLVLWFLQLSFNNSGQLFYSYGWETQLAEFTFLTLFLVPPLDPRLKSASYPPPRVVIWAMRWMLFRLMFGAGMIKIRGDECWRDLTCMLYHYETQPIPHPLSYLYHKMPELLHKGAVLVNHFVELIVPFGLFGPARVRRLAGVFTVLFQLILISSGNLAWLNWLTLLMCVPCFDDEFLKRWTPAQWIQKAKALAPLPSRLRIAVLSVFSAVILFLSIQPALNLVSDRQAMNTSYGYWHLVNSYGAFGSIGRDRWTIVIRGTQDSTITANTVWEEYQFKCAPGDIYRVPCLITPYHMHFDWQIWFSAMRPELQEEWLFRTVVRLLENNKTIKDLFAKNPFGEEAPKFIKMDLYKYRFSEFSDWPHKWWDRDLIKEYMPAVSLETPLTERFRAKN